VPVSRDPRPAGFDHAQEVLEGRELTIAPDHRDGSHRALSDRSRRSQCEPRPNRGFLALRRDRLGRAVLDGAARARVGLLADENGSDWRGGLESRCRVHDVTSDHRLAVARTRFELDDRLTGVDGDPNLQVILVCPITNGERGPNGTLWVVSVRDRRPEDTHDCVADELLHGSSELLELSAHLLVVRPEDVPNVLGVELLGARGEANEVHEEHGDDPPLLSGSSPARTIIGTGARPH